MSREWTVESIIKNRIEEESDTLIEEFQKTVQYGKVIDDSAKIIAEMRFIQKSIESERFWREFYEGKCKRLEERLTKEDE